MVEVAALVILISLFTHRVLSDPKRIARKALERRKAAQRREALLAIRRRIEKRRAILAKLAAEEKAGAGSVGPKSLQREQEF